MVGRPTASAPRTSAARLSPTIHVASAPVERAIEGPRVRLLVAALGGVEDSEQLTGEAEVVEDSGQFRDVVREYQVRPAPRGELAQRRRRVVEEPPVARVRVCRTDLDRQPPRGGWIYSFCLEGAHENGR